MRKCSMQLTVTVAGGRNGNILKPGGRLTRVTMSHFVEQAIVGGKKERAFGR